MLGHIFDPKSELLTTERLRPHWAQAGAIVFVTFRTVDSIPKEVLNRWDREKDDWIRRHGFPHGLHWSEIVPQLSDELRAGFLREFNRCRETFLDTCHGRCLLRSPEMAQIVADTLLHFDGQRYRMGDFIVMPNHVHLLAAFASPEDMRKQFDSWVHYSAAQVNKLLGEKAHFWQQEPFDHLVRSAEQYEYLRRYIADNPRKANLRPGEYLHHRYEP